MTAKAEPALVSITGVVAQVGVNDHASSKPWLAVGLALDEHADDKLFVVMAPVDVAADLYAGREITLEVRLR